MSDSKGYYQTLGVKTTATADEIRKAFLKLAIKHHPDKGGDQEKFKKINEANKTLSDERERREYDTSVTGMGRPSPTPSYELNVKLVIVSQGVSHTHTFDFNLKKYQHLYDTTEYLSSVEDLMVKVSEYFIECFGNYDKNTTFRRSGLDETISYDLFPEDIESEPGLVGLVSEAAENEETLTISINFHPENQDEDEDEEENGIMISPGKVMSEWLIPDNTGVWIKIDELMKKWELHLKIFKDPSLGGHFPDIKLQIFNRNKSEHRDSARSLGVLRALCIKGADGKMVLSNIIITKELEQELKRKYLDSQAAEEDPGPPPIVQSQITDSSSSGNEVWEDPEPYTPPIVQRTTDESSGDEGYTSAREDLGGGGRHKKRKKKSKKKKSKKKKSKKKKSKKKKKTRRKKKII